MEEMNLTPMSKESHHSTGHSQERHVQESRVLEIGESRHTILVQRSLQNLRITLRMKYTTWLLEFQMLVKEYSRQLQLWR